MITLPPLERACLKTATLIIGVLNGMSLGLFLWLLGVDEAFAWGGFFALFLILTGFLTPRFARLEYRIWKKAGFEFARHATGLMTWICFYVIVVAVGRTGAVLKPTPPPGPEESMWIVRKSLPEKSYYSQHASDSGEPAHSNWISSFTSWAFNSGNLWCCALLPFLICLAALDRPTDDNIPTDIYTLY
jgi:hypothetical protein